MGKKETVWPAEPFYIQSKVGGDNYVLTTTNNTDVTLRRFNGTLAQLWQAQTDTRGSAFLKNLASGRVLTALYGAGRGKSPAASLTDLNSDDISQQWRIEDLGAGSFGIVYGTDWDLRLNVYRSDVNGKVALYAYSGGAANERWMILKELGAANVKRTDYDLANATHSFDVPAMRSQESLVNNLEGATSITQTVTINRSRKTTSSVTNTRSNTSGEIYTQTFGVKGGQDKVWEVSATFGFQQSQSRTFSLATQETQETADSDTVSFQVVVPPRSKYACYLLVKYGKVSIPFKSYIEFKSSVPGVAPVNSTIEGVYEGVNATSTEIVVVDKTPKAAADQVEVHREAVPPASAASAAIIIQPKPELAPPPEPVITVVPAD